ncbi:MAG: hypothetical protein IJL63_07930 [Clostridia bacterium]|nr:hypothetical protein [Clostridia bacterium]
MKKKILALIMCIVMVFGILPVYAFAFKPSPGINVWIDYRSLSDNVAYIDLLLPAEFVDTNPESIAEKTVASVFLQKVITLPDSCEIAGKQTVNGQAYYSFLFYYPKAEIDIYDGVENSDYSEYFSSRRDGEETDLVSVFKGKDLMFAFVDESGKVLAVSNKINIKGNVFAINNLVITGIIADNEISVNFYTVLPLFWALIIINLVITFIVLKRKKKKSEMINKSN